MAAASSSVAIVLSAGGRSMTTSLLVDGADMILTQKTRRWGAKAIQEAQNAIHFDLQLDSENNWKT